MDDKTADIARMLPLVTAIMEDLLHFESLLDEAARSAGPAFWSSAWASWGLHRDELEHILKGVKLTLDGETVSLDACF